MNQRIVSEFLGDFRDIVETKLNVTNMEIEDRAIPRFLIYVGNTYPTASLLTNEMITNLWEYIQNSATIRAFVFDVAFHFTSIMEDEELSSLVSTLVIRQESILSNQVDSRLKQNFQMVEHPVALLSSNAWLLACILLSMTLQSVEVYAKLIQDLRKQK